MLMLWVPTGAELEMENISPVLALLPAARLMARLVQLALIPTRLELLFEWFMVQLVSFILVRVIVELLFAPVWMFSGRVFPLASSTATHTLVPLTLVACPQLGAEG